VFADSRAFAELPSGAEKLVCLGGQGVRFPTKLSSSPESSSVAGSGIPPSITHRLDSYFVRTKFSIFLEKLVGRSRGKKRCEHTFPKGHAPAQDWLPSTYCMCEQDRSIVL